MQEPAIAGQAGLYAANYHYSAGQGRWTVDRVRSRCLTHDDYDRINIPECFKAIAKKKERKKKGKRERK